MPLEVNRTSAAQEMEDTYEEAQIELQRLGIGVVRNAAPPHFDGTIPNNLPDLDSRELGDLLGEATNYSNFMSSVLADLSGRCSTLTEAHKIAVAQVRQTLQSISTKYEKDDLVLLDQRVLKISISLQRYEVQRKYVAALYEIARNAYSAISREISRRDSDTSQQHRTANVQSRRRQGRVAGGGRRD